MTNEEQRFDRICYDYHQFGVRRIGYALREVLIERGLVHGGTGTMTKAGCESYRRHIERCSK